ncbi:multi-copper oxidase laccase-like protein [Melampsora larici-populina 98AG31]|uniref:Multi-copper oxidase laccase-like protein n=1 Tax=Melampsora larici-populina (strain 98AG31 / pathotype 3-4-7) TaxID=747676 RepID=F4RZG5_MELLP|nr:multi-copper oxidase laccase-like protein [Melampsora larici-populina 98AG31]EGG02257.1 multi-copper oxidase laccase-like protein [Melampsora larici-populina 98AG31]
MFFPLSTASLPQFLGFFTFLYVLLVILSVAVLGEIQFNPSELVLSPNFDINSGPQIRNYTFTVRSVHVNMLVINNQYPGPLIEVNIFTFQRIYQRELLTPEDTISVLVKNELNIEVSIHWHGMFQRGTPWMDGVTGVTQCAIPAGTSFRYTFTITDQFGTYWYHAHAQALNADGIAGPLIVHSPRDPLKRDVNYNRDMIVFIADWFHDQSTAILAGQLSAAGYKNTTAAPSPNSALINGVGQFNCQYADAGDICGPNTGPLQIQVEPKQRTRLRLIQAGSHAMFRVSVDNHPLTVVEADSTGVQAPQPVHRVPRLQFHNGQRYSVILDTTSDQAGSSFFLRAAMDTDCFAWLAPGIGACIDLDPDTLSPLLSKDPETNVIGRVVFYESSFGIVMTPNPSNPQNSQALGRFFVDNTTWTTFVYKPLLQQFLSGGSQTVNSSQITALTLSTQGTYDIVINNLDSGIDHVYHLHGVDSSIVAQGSGQLTDSQAQKLQYRTSNPMRRDTMVVRGGSYIVGDTRSGIQSGVWILHCHISFHLAAGFAGVIVMQPSEIAKMTLPAENQALCSAANPQNVENTTPGQIASTQRLRARRVR